VTGLADSNPNNDPGKCQWCPRPDPLPRCPGCLADSNPRKRRPEEEGQLDLKLALARLYDAVQSENFNRPARAPEMSTKLRAALKLAKQVLDG
jgi:hypothetical protein